MIIEHPRSTDVDVRFMSRWHVVPVSLNGWLLSDNGPFGVSIVAHAVRLRDIAYSGFVVAGRREYAEPYVDVEENDYTTADIPQNSLWLATFEQPNEEGNRWVDDTGLYFDFEAAQKAYESKRKMFKSYSVNDECSSAPTNSAT